MPRFVLLHHECPPGFGKPSHWDLMLETGEELATWSLLELPTGAGSIVAATKLPDHRIAYLDYEGPLSGARGAVRRVDAGDFDLIESSATRWVIRFTGQMLAGVAVFEEVGGEAWTFAVVGEPPTG